ncbi:hypothetical protein [Bacillus salipaludis]|uniref:hypothetical protein n=1 Tax=Bacillus salipaludis TaxID=2547811 RepID=UPI002E1B1832|nr:hypothetical protein [Bacillus salipaludis]
MIKFLKNAGTVISLLLMTLCIIGGSLSGTYKDSAAFYELMKESSKLNVSVAFGLGAIVFACQIVQNKTELKVNKEKYYNYLGIMFYFIVLNLGVFYLSYFPRVSGYQVVLVLYFVLTMTFFSFLLFATSKILGTIFNKKSL